jgi:hypothetical protein
MYNLCLVLGRVVEGGCQGPADKSASSDASEVSTSKPVAVDGVKAGILLAALLSLTR